MKAMEAEIIALVKLTTDEVEALRTAGCNSSEELSVLEHVDLQKILKSSTVVKVRSLSRVAWYLASVGIVRDTTTMQDIISSQHQAKYGNKPVVLLDSL